MFNAFRVFDENGKIHDTFATLLKGQARGRFVVDLSAT
jgi:hypothetical protein